MVKNRNHQNEFSRWWQRWMRSPSPVFVNFYDAARAGWMASVRNNRRKSVRRVDSSAKG